MAKHLARIHGTEEDKVNCPFYYKIGACRHSDRCSRLHHKPAFSPTLLIKHLYRHPQRLAELRQAATAGPAVVDVDQAREEFFCFYEDLYMEFSKFGRIDALHVCDNLGDHMIGHVYCKFMDEEEAADALEVMNSRFYDGRRMEVEYSPVQNFQEARCRDFDEENCSRGGFCNFMHVKPVPPCLVRSLEDDAEDERREKDRDERRRKREDHRSSKHGRRYGDGDEDDRRNRSKRSRRTSSRGRSASYDEEEDRSKGSYRHGGDDSGRHNSSDR
eukprot:Nitzschia sp. Nitz4//scaffold53_size117307//108250//109461//NITZ4_003784-RA/size117307-augustus-gene-0.101-mRNA-1//-1//CDS//3329554247//6065//frame0